MGFIDDKDGDQQPYPLLIQEKKAWNLEKINMLADEIVVTTYYGDEANGGSDRISRAPG